MVSGATPSPLARKTRSLRTNSIRSRGGLSQKSVEKSLSSTEGNKVNEEGREAGPLLFVSFC
jgi:hypothetical protein